ncbi:hypothetical protein CPT_Madawaska_239 [Staphylococcus phage Madawaska]|nr:hypothetical protein CPT_Madawaska_239 [Staphylococcus phage Madawaska]
MEDKINQIENYVDVDKLNAISNYLYGIDYNKKEYSGVREQGALVLGRVERKEILEFYMTMDKNDIQHYLAKKIEGIGNKHYNAMSEFGDLVKIIKGFK